MAIDNYTTNAVNPSVPVNLTQSKAALFAVRASVSPGSFIWFLSDLAHQLVCRALKELDAAKGVKA